MGKTRTIEVRESILADNAASAAGLRAVLEKAGCVAVNVMGSPGSGKTTLILATIARLGGGHRAAVIEADLDSSVDADLIRSAGYDAVQLHTGGFCHLDASMTAEGFAALGFRGLGAAEPADGSPHAPLPAAPDSAAPYDLVFVENVGNLICTAEVDIGSRLNLALLSLPEGDDKPLKYPVMFRAADVVLVTKRDFSSVQEFDLEEFERRVKFLNPGASIFALSARTGEGMEAWLGFLREVLERRAGRPS